MQAHWGVFFGLGTFILWGVGDFIAALLCRRDGIRSALFWTQILGLALAALIPLFFETHRDSLFALWQPREMIFLVLLGAVQALGYAAFYKGLGEGIISVVCPVSSAWALVAVLWGWWVWGEELVLAKYIGIAALMIGIFFTAFQPAEVRNLTGRQLARGSFEGLIAMLTWGISFTLIVPLVREFGWFGPIYWMRLWAFLFLVPFLLGFRHYWKSPLRPSLHWGYAAVAVCDIGGVFSFSEGVRSAFASIVAPVSSAFPLITVLLAAYFFREKISLSQKGGILLVLVGLVLISL